MADTGAATRHVVIADSLVGVTLPDPESGINDRHFWDVHTPGIAPNSAILFFRVQHSGEFALSVRVNQHRVLSGHMMVGPSPSFFRFCIPGAMKEQNNEIIVSGTGARSVTIRDVFILYSTAERVGSAS